MKIRIKVKDAILITISLILIWVIYFLIKDYQFNVENIDGHLSVTKTNLATKKYENIAVEALYAKEYDKAIEYLNKSLELDDKLISTYLYLCLSYDGISKMSRAKENYEKVITMEGRNKNPEMVKNSL